jgi:hypothetical protein
MDERVLKLRTSKDAEALARNASRIGRPDIAEQATLRALELRADERSSARRVRSQTKHRAARENVPSGRVGKPALFLNGVYESVLNEILDAQAAQPGLVGYLQPYKPVAIKRLQEDAPSPERPWRLFMSLTHSLGLISFEADIVEWRDKATLDNAEISSFNQRIIEHQPNEGGLHLGEQGGDYGRNLLGIVDLRRIEPALSVSGFVKISDDLPLRDRTRAGGWSYIMPPQFRSSFEVIAEEGVLAAEAKELQKAINRTHEDREARLADAESVPQSVFVVSKVFRRNQDVIAEVLARAAGTCEDCKRPAPFLRAKDGTPFLEVHHVETLARGGLDTVQNAVALCPNCHRKRHHG